MRAEAPAEEVAAPVEEAKVEEVKEEEPVVLTPEEALEKAIAEKEAQED